MDAEQANGPYDFGKIYEGQFEALSPEKGTGFIYVTLEDGTEEQFFVGERTLRRALYFMNTPSGTTMRVRLGRDERHDGRVIIDTVEKNKTVYDRPHASTLPWHKAELLKDPAEAARDFVFLTVKEPTIYSVSPMEVYVSKRLFRASGYPDSEIKIGSEFNVRIIQTERGLQVVQLRYPEGFKPRTETE